jgi:hypothetical protein
MKWQGVYIVVLLEEHIDFALAFFAMYGSSKHGNSPPLPSAR